MKTKVGLWIDHRRAVVLTLSDDGETRQVVESDVEKHVGFSGGSAGSRGSRAGGGEESRERRFAGHLNQYYDEVISHIRDADAILILGPGEAPGELRARIEHAGLGARIVGVEKLDKLTDLELAAKVRAHFSR